MTMFQGLNKINMMCISSHLFESGVDNGTMNLAKPLEMIIRFNHHLGRVFLVHFLTIQWFLSHLQRHLLLSSSSSTQVRFSLQGPTTSLGEAEPIRGSWKKRGSTLGPCLARDQDLGLGKSYLKLDLPVGAQVLSHLPGFARSTKALLVVFADTTSAHGTYILKVARKIVSIRNWFSFIIFSFQHWSYHQCLELWTRLFCCWKQRAYHRPQGPCSNAIVEPVFCEFFWPWGNAR